MALVSALVADCKDVVVVGNTVAEDMDVGDEVGLVRVGEELVGDAGTLVDDSVLGTILHNESRRVCMVTRQLTGMTDPKKTKTSIQEYDIDETVGGCTADVGTKCAKSRWTVVGCSGRF